MDQFNGGGSFCRRGSPPEYWQTAFTLSYIAYQIVCRVRTNGQCFRHVSTHSCCLRLANRSSLADIQRNNVGYYMVSWFGFYPVRRKAAAPNDRLPLRWYVMTAIGLCTTVFLCMNLVGWLVKLGPAPLAIATVFVLSYATVAYIGTYSLFTRG